MGPLEAQKPWNTRDIVGMSRFLNGVWRNLVGDEESDKVAHGSTSVPIPEALDRQTAPHDQEGRRGHRRPCASTPPSPS